MEIIQKNWNVLVFLRYFQDLNLKITPKIAKKI